GSCSAGSSETLVSGMTFRESSRASKILNNRSQPFYELFELKQPLIPNENNCGDFVPPLRVLT
ncbi:MAG TPA: hypothetical protein V6D06_04185, partial [Trichocoleus sp.]